MADGALDRRAERLRRLARIRVAAPQVRIRAMLCQKAAVTATATAARDEDAEHHLVQPCLQVRIGSIARLERQRAQHRFLQQVVGRVAIATQLERSQTQRRQKLAEPLPELTES